MLLVAIFLFEREHTRRTAFERMRKVQATVGLYASNPLGYTWHTMVGTSGCNSVRRSQPLKSDLSSDRGLQLALVKPKSLVTVF